MLVACCTVYSCGIEKKKGAGEEKEIYTLNKCLKKKKEQGKKMRWLKKEYGVTMRKLRIWKWGNWDKYCSSKWKLDVVVKNVTPIEKPYSLKSNDPYWPLNTYLTH